MCKIGNSVQYLAYSMKCAVQCAFFSVVCTKFSVQCLQVCSVQCIHMTRDCLRSSSPAAECWYGNDTEKCITLPYIQCNSLHYKHILMYIMCCALLCSINSEILYITYSGIFFTIHCLLLYNIFSLVLYIMYSLSVHNMYSAQYIFMYYMLSITAKYIK